jgi:hypothetical protein
LTTHREYDNNGRRIKRLFQARFVDQHWTGQFRIRSLEDGMAFDKDNFEEDNELAPLEEEEAGDVDEVAGVEIEESVVDVDSEDEPELPKRSATGPKRGSASTSGSTAKASAGKGSSRFGGAKGPAKKASVGKSKTSAGKSAKKKSGGARGKASKKPAKKAARGGKKKKR